MLALAGGLWFALNYTAWGRYIYAIGGNEQATRLSGVRVARVKLIVYTIAGLTSSFAAIVLTARLMSGQPNAGVGFELDAIAAVVMGGTSISGGRGSIIGTLIGALIVGVFRNGLTLIGVSVIYQYLVTGILVILAVSGDQLAPRRST